MHRRMLEVATRGVKLLRTSSKQPSFGAVSGELSVLPGGTAWWRALHAAPTLLQSLQDLYLQGPAGEADAGTVRQLVITASGPDRPGIVSRVSKRVLECGGNLEESRMARLAGEFSILMLVTVSASTEAKAEELRANLLEIEGLQVHTRWAAEQREVKRQHQRKFRRIALKGADNPGLVYNVTEYLSSNDINIENLETATQEAPFGGSTLFFMDGVITMPIPMSTSLLRAHLDTLQTTLGVDISLHNLDPSTREEDMREWADRRDTGGESKYSTKPFGKGALEGGL